MTTIQPPEIPEEYINFAKAVADIAITNKVAKFQMSFAPHYSFDRNLRAQQDLRIVFSDVDGRGRPCRNLSIEFDAHLKLSIESTPSSFN